MPHVLDDNNNHTTKTGFEVNYRAVVASMDVGIGHNGLMRMCKMLGMPCLSKKGYEGNQKGFIKNIADVEDYALAEAAQVVHNVYKAMNVEVDNDGILDIAVSFDGSWLTRGKGGHSSLIGVGAVVELLTGLVIDFSVKSKYCHSYTLAKHRFGGEDTEEFQTWKVDHGSCSINYVGSSNGMEAAVAETLWMRSVDKHKFRYVEMLSDGDSSTFSHLQRLQPYGPDIQIVKEECVNHVSKRLSTALRNLKKRQRGLGGHGYGKPTDVKIDKLAVYYGRAVSVVEMQKAIMAIFYHSVSTDKEPQHSFCPEGGVEKNWCFYNNALFHGNVWRSCISHF
jgi:hypothetical protein